MVGDVDVGGVIAIVVVMVLEPCLPRKTKPIDDIILKTWTENTHHTRKNILAKDSPFHSIVYNRKVLLLSGAESNGKKPKEEKAPIHILRSTDTYHSPCRHAQRVYATMT